MSTKQDHLTAATGNYRTARELLASGDPDTSRWGVVVAYYTILQIIHACCAERTNSHPDDHATVWKTITNVDPSRQQLRGHVLELYDLSVRARYLTSSGVAVRGEWWAGGYNDHTSAVERASELMEFCMRGTCDLFGFDQLSS